MHLACRRRMSAARSYNYIDVLLGASSQPSPAADWSSVLAMKGIRRWRIHWRCWRRRQMPGCPQLPSMLICCRVH